MPWPSPKQDLAIEALRPAARRALYALFVSAFGDIGSSLSNDPDPEGPNLEVSRTRWLEEELYQLDKQHVQLLAFYDMRYRGRVLPESCDAQVPTAVTVSPDLVHAFSQFKIQEDVPIDVGLYYNCNNPTIIDVAGHRGEESAARFIQESFMLMAIGIEKNDQDNMLVNKIRQGILDRLPESPEPTLSDILNCLINCIRARKYIPEAERFVLERWVFENTDIIRRKVARAFHSGLITVGEAGGP